MLKQSSEFIVETDCIPSRMGLASRICCSIHECLPLIAAKYCKINLVLSVLPAPDSPLEPKENTIKLRITQSIEPSFFLLLDWIRLDFHGILVGLGLNGLSLDFGSNWIQLNPSILIGLRNRLDWVDFGWILDRVELGGVWRNWTGF